MEWHVTLHASSRLIRRFRPDLEVHQAHVLLIAAADKAILMRERTQTGQERWLLPDLGVVAICKLDKDRNQATYRVVVTIQPAADVPPELPPAAIDFLERQAQAQVQAQAEAKAAQLARATAKVERTTKYLEESLSRPHVKQTAVTTEQVINDRVLAREAARTERHRINQENQTRHIKNALRVAIRALVVAKDTEALNRIAEYSPGFITPAFYDLDVDSAAETRAAMTRGTRTAKE